MACNKTCPHDGCTGKCYKESGHDSPGIEDPDWRGEGIPKNPHWCDENLDHSWYT